MNTGKEATRELAEEVAIAAFAVLEAAREVARVKTETDSRPLRGTTEEILQGTIGLLGAALEALNRMAKEEQE